MKRFIVGLLIGLLLGAVGVAGATIKDAIISRGDNLIYPDQGIFCKAATNGLGCLPASRKSNRYGVIIGRKGVMVARVDSTGSIHTVYYHAEP